MKRRKTEDEARMERFIAEHPLLHSPIPQWEKAEIMLRDAEAANPARTERFARAVMEERLTELIGYIQSGDTRKARKILDKLPPAIALSLMQAITKARAADSTR